MYTGTINSASSIRIEGVDITWHKVKLAIRNGFSWAIIDGDQCVFLTHLDKDRLTKQSPGEYVYSLQYLKEQFPTE